MAITRTSLHNGPYLRRIKAAVLRAVRKANKPDAVRGIGTVDVYNSRDHLSLVVVARKGNGFEIFDNEDRDVTGLIKSALVSYHASMRV